MQYENSSPGWTIVKWIIFVILAIAAIKIAFWLLGVVVSLLVMAINVAVIVLIIAGIYYLVFGRRKSKF